MTETEIGTPVKYKDFSGEIHNALVTDTYGNALESKSSIGLLFVVADNTTYKVEYTTSVSFWTAETQTNCWKLTS